MRLWQGKWEYTLLCFTGSKTLSICTVVDDVTVTENLRFGIREPFLAG